MRRGSHQTKEAKRKLHEMCTKESSLWQSEAFKRKMRNVNLGALNPNFGKHGNLGYKFTEEQKAFFYARKGSLNPCYGRPRTEEEIKHLRKVNSDGRNKLENHPNWKGGIGSKLYPFGFNDPLKERIRKRDGYQCQKCGILQSEYFRRLDVHHIDSCKENLDPKNLLTLCNKCNITIDSDQEFWAKFFQEVV